MTEEKLKGLPPMERIETMAEDLHMVQDNLKNRLAEAEAMMDEIREEFAPHIRKIANAESDLREKLEREIAANKDLFAKPKTRVFHNIKLGLRRLKGSLKWTDSTELMKRVRQVCPEHEGAIIEVSYTIKKAGLEKLDAGKLKKLGVTIEADTDAVVLKPVEGDLSKMADAFLAAHAVRSGEVNG